MYDEQGVQNLAVAIVAQAAKDYAKAIVNKEDPRCQKAIVECENFFIGKGGLNGIDGWFEMLYSNLDGVEIMERVRDRGEEFAKLIDYNQPFNFDEEEAKRISFACPFCKGKVEISLRIGHRKNAAGEMEEFKQITYGCRSCTQKFTGEFGVLKRCERTCFRCVYSNMVDDKLFCGLKNKPIRLGWTCPEHKTDDKLKKNKK